MRLNLILVWLFAGLCILVCNFGCQNNQKNNTKATKVIAKTHKAAIKPNYYLKPDSEKIIRDSLAKAYNMLPKISLPFLPSSPMVSCKELKSDYTTQDYEDRPYIEGQTYLESLDTAFLIAKLKNKRPVVVNPEGGTSFGSLDYRASTDTLDGTNDMQNTIEDAVENSKIGVVWAKKVGDNFMCYIIISNQIGILMLITPQGEILDWMPSKRSLGGMNPHGDIERMFSVSTNNAVTITEYSYGDNSDIYKFYANYMVKNRRFILQKRKLHMISYQGDK